MRKINKNCAGADIGSKEIFIGLESGQVKSFGTVTQDLYKAIDFLESQGITSVAMEATGVYWISFYDLLEKRGIEPYLVNPYDSKNLPGRKTDVLDCQWIQKLHSHGLLRRCFVPESSIRELRIYMRLRSDHIGMASSHVNHMHKALIQMNIRLHEVISRIQSGSGLKVIHAIIEGERSPDKLLGLCSESMKKNKGEIIKKSLEGNYTEEHLFALKQALDLFNYYQLKIQECDKKCEALLNKLIPHELLLPNTGQSKPTRHNNPEINNLHCMLVTLTNGQDPTLIPGITDYSFVRLISELGTNMDRWPTAKHFTSYLGLSPGSNQSGKMRKRSKQKVTTVAGQIFKESSQSLLISKNNALGAFGRRIRARKGAPVAIKAIARKLAVMYYNVLTKGEKYVEKGAQLYEERYKLNQRYFVIKKAKELGLNITEN